MEFPSHLSNVGKRLINHVIRTIPDMDQDSCEWQCYLDHDCVSINLQFTRARRGLHKRWPLLLSWNKREFLVYYLTWYSFHQFLACKLCSRGHKISISTAFWHQNAIKDTFFFSYVSFVIFCFCFPECLPYVSLQEQRNLSIWFHG